MFGSIIQDMVIDMNEARLNTVGQLTAFLEGTLAFTAIPEVIECAMDAHERNGTSRIRDLDDVRVIDGWARDFAGRSASGANPTRTFFDPSAAPLGHAPEWCEFVKST